MKCLFDSLDPSGDHYLTDAGGGFLFFCIPPEKLLAAQKEGSAVRNWKLIDFVNCELKPLVHKHEPKHRKNVESYLISHFGLKHGHVDQSMNLLNKVH